MSVALASPLESVARLNLRAVLDILIIAIVLYYLMNLLRGTRAAQMILAIALLALIFYGAHWAELEMVAWLLNTLLPYIAIALIVLFQPEIRRALARVGRTPFWQQFSARNPAGVHDDVVMAASYFAQNRIGALVVFERATSLKTYVESGIPLDATLSYDLLLAIFRPGAPLHDGAAIIQNRRLAAAACFLPLSLNPMLSNQLGCRHRAAIGVTEESDAIAVVVSEHSGAIALAAGGAIEMNLTPEQLAERLATCFARFGAPAAPAGPRPAARAE